MLRAMSLATSVLLLLWAPARADNPSDLGANAALKYWQAFATLPKFTDAEGQKIFAGYLTMPLDAHAKEIVAKAEYALKMMHYGAALQRCEWGMPYEEGVDMLLPQGPAARLLTSIACLRARMHFEQGQNAKAIDDLLANFTLARQISRDGINIIVLVGYGIEHRTGETLALYLPKLSPEAIKDVKRRIDALPAGGNPAAAVKFEEKSALDWFVRKVKETKDKEGLLNLLALVSQLAGPEGQTGDWQEKARGFLESCGGTPEGVLKKAEEVRGAYARVTKMLELPLDQFEKEWEELTQKQSANVVFKVFFPAYEKMRRQQARAEVRSALLTAAIAVQLEGRDALKNHADPVSGGLFRYTAFDGGFELHSKLKGLDDKPLTLTVGVRGK
jgi:hypothetical protein